MENVIDLSTYRADRDHAEQKVRELQEARRKEAEEAGSSALLQLKRRKKGLILEDCTAIARNVYAELQRLRSACPNVKFSDLVIEAGISNERSAKELHRMSLPLGGDAKKRGIRKDPAKYLRLIRAIQSHTKENINVLADRVLFGTSLHPLGAADLEMFGQVHVLLQESVNRIDKDFDLFAKFQKTLKLREEHIRNGGSEFWPDNSEEVHHLDAMLENNQLSDTDRQNLLEEKRFVLERNPFWHFSYEEGGPEALGLALYGTNWAWGFIPHAYLGFYTDATPTERKYFIPEALSPTIRWDEDAKNFSRCDVGTMTAWLLIYPNDDMTGLMPALFTVYDIPGLTPISPRTLAEFADITKWAYISTESQRTLFDRIKELCGYGTGRFVIDEEWRKTARYFDYNPFLRMDNEERDKERNFRAMVAGFLKGTENDNGTA